MILILRLVNPHQRLLPDMIKITYGIFRCFFSIRNCGRCFVNNGPKTSHSVFRRSKLSFWAIVYKTQDREKAVCSSFVLALHASSHLDKGLLRPLAARNDGKSHREWWLEAEQSLLPWISLHAKTFFETVKWWNHAESRPSVSPPKSAKDESNSSLS